MSGLNFVGLDVETANAKRGSICAVGAVIIENGHVVRRQHWLTRPPQVLNWFDTFNVSLHGISAQDVVGKPDFATTLSEVLEFVGERTVVAHNAAFDVGALRQACTADALEWPSLDYGCSLVMSRRALSLISNRLPIVCEELGIRLDQHHRADADAEAAARIVVELARREGPEASIDWHRHCMFKSGTYDRAGGPDVSPFGK